MTNRAHAAVRKEEKRETRQFAGTGQNRAEPSRLAATGQYRAAAGCGKFSSRYQDHEEKRKADEMAEQHLQSSRKKRETGQ
jgi:hypothetical protein